MATIGQKLPFVNVSFGAADLKLLLISSIFRDSNGYQ